LVAIEQVDRFRGFQYVFPLPCSPTLHITIALVNSEQEPATEVAASPHSFDVGSSPKSIAVPIGVQRRRQPALTNATKFVALRLVLSSGLPALGQRCFAR
jgi:hypothetical protein